VGRTSLTGVGTPCRAPRRRTTAVARVPLHRPPGEAVEQDRRAHVGRRRREAVQDALGVVVSEAGALGAPDGAA
jgi:hypothetical protein